MLHAAEAFLEHGYRATTTRMIAEKAKVNSALINYYFGDKKTLYLQVMRYWAQDAFQAFPFEMLNDPAADPWEKVRRFIFHTLVCLFGPQGRGTGFGRLLALEAAVSPSEAAHEIVSETIGQPTQALAQAIGQITGETDPVVLQTYTACIVGQTVYFYLSRNLTEDLLGVAPVQNTEDIAALSERIYTFCAAALQGLRRAIPAGTA